MAIPSSDLAATVLGLPPEERARILELLLSSFEPKSEAQSHWIALARKRRDEVLAGTVALIPGEEALARIKARLV